MDDPTRPLRIKDISIEDLLGRDPITLDIEALNEWLNDKKVLITEFFYSKKALQLMELCILNKHSILTSILLMDGRHIFYIVTCISINF